MSAEVNRLPFGVGRTSRGWWMAAIVALVAVGLGIFAYARQAVEGEIVTGMRDIGTMGGAPWGIYVVLLIYCMGVSFAGITLAVLARLARIEELRPVARMAEAVTLVSLAAGALFVLVDVGRPLHAIGQLLKYARPGSPMFGTFALALSGYFLAAVTYFYLEARPDAAELLRLNGGKGMLYRLGAAGYGGSAGERVRRQRASFWLAIAILPLLVTATSTLGFVFGLQVGRAGWFSALQAPGFVILAGMSGTGILVLVAAVARKAIGGGAEQIPISAFRWLTNLLLILIAAYLYLMAIEWLSASFSGNPTEIRVQQEILTGAYAPFYWAAVGALVIGGIVALGQWVAAKRGGTHSVGAAVVVAVLVNVAALAKRYLIVLPSQTHGSHMPYAVGSYGPSWVELLVSLGIVALAVMLFLLLIKAVPIFKIADTREQGSVGAGGGRRPGRTAAAWSLVVLGLAVQVVSYFFLAAPLGTPTAESFSQPRMPFAPLLFLVGVALVFAAACVYELGGTEGAAAGDT